MKSYVSTKLRFYQRGLKRLFIPNLLVLHLLNNI